MNRQELIDHLHFIQERSLIHRDTPRHLSQLAQEIFDILQRFGDDKAASGDKAELEKRLIQIDDDAESKNLAPSSWTRTVIDTAKRYLESS